MKMRLYRYMKFEHAAQSLGDGFFKLGQPSKVDKPLAAKVIAELRGRGETAHIHHFETLSDANKYVYTYKRVA